MESGNRMQRKNTLLISQKIKSQAIKKWRDKVVSIVVYGSYARGEKYRDIDVLVVIKEAKSRLERIEDIFLDIAVEGKILYDTGLVEELVRSTREYIRARKIQKIDTGGIFPIKERVESPLSSITNKEWTGVWIEDAKMVLRDTENAIKMGKEFVRWWFKG